VINRIIPSLATANDGWGLGPFSSLLQGQDAPSVVYFSGKIPLRSCLLTLYIFRHCIQSWWRESFNHYLDTLFSNTLSCTHCSATAETIGRVSVRRKYHWRRCRMSQETRLQASLRVASPFRTIHRWSCRARRKASASTAKNGRILTVTWDCLINWPWYPLMMELGEVYFLN
jgi:hypothetical protein